ncbi:hypothetical protein IE077_000263 [Cardiosporidium cionae]|uniref:Leishmanolysin-like peptidase n=1 Tax=Cardiosporidium cionae TaxID=476202 RepID=A0ABQ7JBZ3_9APIC|nr:hypothetical protein IE077_000263 [Cardiosporidium cionae]|eukprot:KAF8821527.1 hypothetical protein IE077_000263 [Cardiosporidium cionae]
MCLAASKEMELHKGEKMEIKRKRRSISALIILLNFITFNNATEDELKTFPSTYKCSHDEIESFFTRNHSFAMPSQLQKGQGSEDTFFLVGDSTNEIKYFDPMRITFFTNNLASLKIKSPQSYKVLIDDIFPAVGNFLSQVFLVRRKPDKTTWISRDCRRSIRYSNGTRICLSLSLPTCVTTIIPESHLDQVRTCQLEGGELKCEQLQRGTGIQQTDHVVYVNYGPHKFCSSDVLAFASFCKLDEINRPYVSGIHICDHALDLVLLSPSRMMEIVQHELLHGMGFSSSAFRLFRDDAGVPRNNDRRSPDRPSVDSTLLSMNSSGGKPTTWVITPTARDFAKTFFKCNSTRGIAIENQGESGSVGSHIESLAQLEDTMTAALTGISALSNFTLTILRDSGWYGINFHRASNPLW